MTPESQCLPFLPTILSLSITIFMGLIAVVIHLSTDQRQGKAPRPKVRHRGAQTEDSIAGYKKETICVTRQLKQQKMVACNLEEENEGLNGQLALQKQIANDRKVEISVLKEKLQQANAKCAQLAATIKCLQVKGEEEATVQKKNDTEFESAMVMLLDLAEKSVNQEICFVKGGSKDVASATGSKAANFAEGEWAFMMNIAAFNEDQIQESDNETKLLPQQQYDVQSPQLLYNEASPKKKGKERRQTTAFEEKAGMKADKMNKSMMAMEQDGINLGSGVIEGPPSQEENLSPDPDDSIESHCSKPIDLAMLSSGDLPQAPSWTSRSSTSSNSEMDRTLNFHAKPFVPKRQKLQEEIQKRLQQWKDFYYTQVQPQEVAAQQCQQQQSWPDGQMPACGTQPSQRHQQPTMANVSWDQHIPHYPPLYSPCPEQYAQAIVQDKRLDEMSSYHESWDQSSPSSEMETWPPASEVQWTSHQPYTYHCHCTSCLQKEGYQSSESIEARPSDNVDYERLGDQFSNVAIGLTFKFPSLCDREQTGQWSLAHEGFEPFYLARYTSSSGADCQLVITEEYLKPAHTLISYVALSKHQTEQTLASYNLVFQSERQVVVNGCQAYEVIYSQGTQGNMLVWSLCIFTYGRVLTLQVVAANGSKYGIMSSLHPMMESIKLSAPLSTCYPSMRKQPLQPRAAMPDCVMACMTIQRAVRCWHARQIVRFIRKQQHNEEREENDVFIKVTTRINPNLMS